MYNGKRMKILLCLLFVITFSASAYAQDVAAKCKYFNSQTAKEAAEKLSEKQLSSVYKKVMDSLYDESDWFKTYAYAYYESKNGENKEAVKKALNNHRQYRIPKIITDLSIQATFDICKTASPETEFSEAYKDYVSKKHVNVRAKNNMDPECVVFPKTMFKGQYDHSNSVNACSIKNNTYKFKVESKDDPKKAILRFCNGSNEDNLNCKVLDNSKEGQCKSKFGTCRKNKEGSACSWAHTEDSLRCLKEE